MQVITDGIKSLKSMVRSQNQASAPGSHRSVVLSICSQKGGVGKTTTAVNVAYNLAQKQQKKTLLIDLDPQGHVETSLTSIIPDGQRYRPLSSILLDRKPNMLEAVVQTQQNNFFVTPGDKSLIETDSLLTTKIGKEFLMREALKEANDHYDVIVIDCPPNLGNLTLNALVSSHYCIVPCEMSTLSLEGVSDIFETIDTINERLNRKLMVLGILLTRVDARNQTMNQAVLDQLNKHAKGYLFTTQIVVNTDLAKAQLAGRPVQDYAPQSSGAKSYEMLGQELMSRIEEFQGKVQAPVLNQSETI